MVINRIGDLGLLLGISSIFEICQSINFDIVFSLVPYFKNYIFNYSFINIQYLSMCCLFLFIGSMGKSAQLGLHSWLPDAMEGPTPVSALIHAATMVTAGVFLLIRCSPLFEYSPTALNFVALIGSFTAFFGSSIGFVQNDIKKIVAYSTMSQLGYMVFGCGLSGYLASFYHLVNHAFIKALLFLVSGALIHGLFSKQDIRFFGDYFNINSVCVYFFLLGSGSLVGIPFFSGYYSKDLILEIAYSQGSCLGRFGFSLGLLSVIFTTIYSIRLLYFVFFSECKFVSNFSRSIRCIIIYKVLNFFF